MRRQHLFSTHSLRIAGRVAALALAAAAVIAPASAALATWSTGGSGSAGAAAATMPTGVAPSGAGSGLSITISWAPATFANGAPVAGYTVARFDAATGQQAPVGGTCAGVVGVTTCTETVPPGTWVYTDTPVQGSWTGGQSPQSAPIHAVG